MQYPFYTNISLKTYVSLSLGAVGPNLSVLKLNKLECDFTERFNIFICKTWIFTDSMYKPVTYSAISPILKKGRKHCLCINQCY